MIHCEIGNAVCPLVAEALTGAYMRELAAAGAMAA